MKKVYVIAFDSKSYKLVKLLFPLGTDGNCSFKGDAVDLTLEMVEPAGVTNGEQNDCKRI